MHAELYENVYILHVCFVLTWNHHFFISPRFSSYTMVLDSQTILHSTQHEQYYGLQLRITTIEPSSKILCTLNYRSGKAVKSLFRQTGHK